jgi:hypothetical protein
MPTATDTPATKRNPRHRPMVTVTLSPEAIEMLEKLAAANGTSKSALVEALVRQRAGSVLSFGGRLGA